MKEFFEGVFKRTSVFILVAGAILIVNIQSQDLAARKDVWLNFQVENSQPLPYGDGSKEWTIYLKPKPLGDEWTLLRVNLADEIERSFGMKGWKLRKLRGFRLRGNLQLAYIRVF